MGDRSERAKGRGRESSYRPTVTSAGCVGALLPVFPADYKKRKKTLLLFFNRLQQRVTFVLQKQLPPAVHVQWG